MQEVRAAAAEAGDARIHARALQALGEVALFMRADAQSALALIEEALQVLGGHGDAEARFGALMARGEVAGWLGDARGQDEWFAGALDVARDAQRTDLEATATRALARMFVQQLELDRAETLIERSLELAEESGSITSRAQALGTQAIYLYARGRVDEAQEAIENGLALYEEIGHPLHTAAMRVRLGAILRRRGELAHAEKILRDAVRVLKGLANRGTLCEAQRELAQVLVAQRKVDDAERFALEARETVGPEDRVSLSTTKIALGVVRAAQGRDDAAEELLREALEELAASDFRLVELEALEELAQFLRDRGRDDEAALLESRLASLAPSSTARIA
jgi:tetratricopeptide (TPR) repeat protein